MDKLANTDETKKGKAFIGDTAKEHSDGGDQPRALKGDAVNHPSHYTYGTIETIDYIEDKGFTYNLGNAIKYISRAGHKLDAIEDLKKAVWYVNREIQRLEKNNG